MSLPPLGGPVGAPLGGGGGGCVVPVVAAVVPGSVTMLFKPCSSELLVGDAPLPTGAVALPKAASPEVLPVRLAISDCRFARIGAAPVPPCVPGVVFGDPVVEALPLVKTVPPAAPLPVAESSPPQAS
jgi:hypothetical protein